MSKPMCLNHMNAMELDPAAFVCAAAEAGCTSVSLFAYSPDFIIPSLGVAVEFPAVTQATKPEVLAALRETGVSVSGVEFFPLVPGIALERFRPAMALGAELGASRTVCHIHDTERTRATESYGELCDLAASEGLAMAIEYTPLAPGGTDLATAKWLVGQVGRSNAGIVVDCLHVVRSGGTVEEVAALDPGLIAYAQICDGFGLQVTADYLGETGDRVLPGLGDFPVAEIIAALPAGVEIEVEVPSATRIAADLPAVPHMREAMRRTREMLEVAGRG